MYRPKVKFKPAGTMQWHRYLLQSKNCKVYEQILPCATTATYYRIWQSRNEDIFSSAKASHVLNSKQIIDTRKERTRFWLLILQSKEIGKSYSVFYE